MGIIKRNFANNILSSGTFDATKLTGDIPAGNLSANAPAFDDNKVVNDLATLGLRVHTQNNLNASNTNSQFIDVFQDASGIDTTTTVVRNANEYVSSVTPPTGGVDDDTIFLVDGVDATNPFRDLVNNYNHVSLNDLSATGGTPTRSTGVNKWGSNAVLDLNKGTINYGTNISAFDPSNAFTIEFWFQYKENPIGRERYFAIGNDSSYPELSFGIDHGSSADINVFNDSNNVDPPGTFDLQVGNRSWNHWAFVKIDNSTSYSFYFNGTRVADASDATIGNINSEKFRINGRSELSAGVGTEYFNMYLTDFMIHSKAKYTGSSFSGGTLSEKASLGAVSATGNFTGTTITAPSTVSSMGAVITYQDNVGTNALNTDIVLQLSADGGSNYTTATLEALPDFSSGIKMAKVNDLAIGTPGTQLKYKISFANQSSGSKEARIRGVSLNY